MEIQIDDIAVSKLMLGQKMQFNILIGIFVHVV